MNNPRFLFVEDLKEIPHLTSEFSSFWFHTGEVEKCYCTPGAQIASQQAWSVELVCFYCTVTKNDNEVLYVCLFVCFSVIFSMNFHFFTSQEFCFGHRNVALNLWFPIEVIEFADLCIRSRWLAPQTPVSVILRSLEKALIKCYLNESNGFCMKVIQRWLHTVTEPWCYFSFCLLVMCLFFNT